MDVLPTPPFWFKSVIVRDTAGPSADNRYSRGIESSNPIDHSPGISLVREPGGGGSGSAVIEHAR